MRGRRMDVYAEELINNCYLIWADEGYAPIIRKVEGVSHVIGEGNPYFIKIDFRYDVEFVLAEIEAAIKCNPPAELAAEEE